MITGTSAVAGWARSVRHTSMPLTSGRLRSRMMTSGRSRCAAASAAAPLEEAWQVLGGDADGGVLHLDAHQVSVGDAGRAQGDAAGLGRVLDRVVEEVDEHLLDGALVGGDAREGVFELLVEADAAR